MKVLQCIKEGMICTQSWQVIGGTSANAGNGGLLPLEFSEWRLPTFREDPKQLQTISSKSLVPSDHRLIFGISLVRSHKVRF